MRQILIKDKPNRTITDYKFLIKFLKDQECIKKLKFKDHHIKELMQQIQYKEYPQGHEVFKYGQSKNHFSIILKGKLTELIPNSEIENWDILWEQF